MSSNDPPSPTTGPAFWAKTFNDGVDYHPLIAHSADVAAVMHELIAPGNALHARFMEASGSPLDPGPLVAILTYLAAIHDIGKANHGFQDKAGPWRRPGPDAWGSTGHVRPLMETIHARIHATYWLELVEGFPWDEADLMDMLSTSFAHHGRPVSGDRRTISRRLEAIWNPDPRTGREPLTEVRRIAQAGRHWAGLPPEGWSEEPFQWTPALTHLFAGLLVTADWIGSSPDLFPPSQEAETEPDEYWAFAKRRAATAVRAIGVRGAARSAITTGSQIYTAAFPEVFEAGARPTPMQEMLATAPLPQPGSRLVIESETGSGKTEAILALYARLRSAGRVDGLLFALPTRATANAMMQRLERCLGFLHPDGDAPTVALAMGGATARIRATSPPAPGETHDEPEDRDLRKWASESAKRFFAAEVVVGTVDQVLLAGLPVKHAHLRLGLLARHFLVVDELHSYDRYMGTVLQSVVDLLCGCGGTAAFLSATLSSGARHALTGDADALTFEEAVTAPYPSVSIHTGDRWSQIATGGSGRTRKLSWTLIDWDDGLQTAISLARVGARVCILRNTVADARATAAIVHERAPDLLWGPGEGGRGTPLHSRYTEADRAVLDEAVLRMFGKGSDHSATILVSTQIVEQSLDVDFDWMLTDLAPVEVLLQRAGRVHRHSRADRPSEVASAALWVHAPREGFEPDVDRGLPHGWGTVYRDILDLELTRRTIAGTPHVELPAMNRLLVEQVFHDEARRRLVADEPEWEDREVRESGRRLSQDIEAVQSMLDLRSSYAELAHRFNAAAEENVRTRIGDDRVTVRLDRDVPGWYSPENPARTLALPLRKLKQADVPTILDPLAEWVRDSEDGPVFSLGKLELRYGRAGWIW